MQDERVLVVDDEPGVRKALEGILRDEGYAVAAAESGEQGLELLEGERFDAVLLDIWLPGIDGLETLNRLRERRVDAEVVMISGHGTIETAVRATKLGAFDFIEKPLSLEKTLLVLRNALRQRRLERRNRRLLDQLSRDTEILGESGGARQLRKQVDAAAGSDAPVVVLGEAGTGRERVVRRIHALSGRSEEAFVKVPCAAFDPETAREALFGRADAPGRIDLAARGSLFLDSPNRLEPDLQRRLAASVDDENFLEKDVRLLSSMAPERSGVVEELRRRLEVIVVEVPPLRERREDVPLMATRFAKETAQEYGRPQRTLAAEAVRAFRAYSWPGNVRELRNLIERLVLTAEGERIELSDLPEDLGGAGAAVVDLYGPFESMENGIRAFERYHVGRALAASGGDRKAAARSLGWTATKLAERIDALGLS